MHKRIELREATINGVVNAVGLAYAFGATAEEVAKAVKQGEEDYKKALLAEESLKNLTDKAHG